MRKGMMVLTAIIALAFIVWYIAIVMSVIALYVRVRDYESCRAKQFKQFKQSCGLQVIMQNKNSSLMFVPCHRVCSLVTEFIRCAVEKGVNEDGAAIAISPISKEEKDEL